MPGSITPARARRRRNALLVALALVVAAPTAAHAAESIPLIDKTEQVGPGITLRHLKNVNADGWFDQQVLTVDLGNAAVTSDLLSSGTVSGGAPISRQADRVGAVAGVNGDFFDIDSTQAAWVRRSWAATC